MAEDADSDMDIKALEELLVEAENENSQPSQEVPKPPRTSSYLEELDDIPVKVPQSESFLEGLDDIPVKNPKRKSSTKPEKRKEASEGESVVHSGDTDSEDDEEKKYAHNRQYNDYGASIKKMLHATEESSTSCFSGYSRGSSSSWKQALKPASGTLCTGPSELKKPSVDLNIDKLTGVRVTNPLISSTVLAERLQGRRVVPFSNIRSFTSNGKITEDWVVVGVIVTKSPPRTSAKGSTYSVLRLSDLRGVGDLKTVSLFLFSGACKTHNKNSVGSVLGILNPSIFDNSKSHGDEASLSVDSADRIMVLGTSRDFAVCKSKKKNGENCTSFVNKANCDYCVYHVKQEYQNCSRRSELQSSFSGKGLGGGLNALRNKVLGKNEVFYGGQSFTAIPAKKSQKLAKQDNIRLAILSGMSAGPVKHAATPKGRLASSVELSTKQAKKDIDRLRKLDQLGVGSNATLNNFSEKLKVEETKTETLAFLSKARETAASKPDQEVHKSFSEENSKIPPKAPSQLSRGAAFALAATQKKPESTINSASAFGLGRKSETSEVLGFAPSEEKTSKIAEKVNNSKKVKEDTMTRSPAESKITSKLIENRITKSLNAPKVVVDESPSVLKASEFGLGRGQKAVPSQRPKVAPTISTASPILGAGVSPTGVIEFDLDSPPSRTPKLKTPAGLKVSVSSTPKSSQKARLKALSYVRAKGAIAKEDPNKLELANKKKALGSKRPEQVKRKIAQVVEVSDVERKKMKTCEEEKETEKMAEFRALMAVTSKHVDLVTKADDEAKDEYFNKLEKKEQMEEKMLNTFKVACKAVTCTLCKYTAFSASDRCKEERHPLKVSDATKRFFKCADCGNRTCCLELFPLKTCSNCNSSRWEKAAMIRERKVDISAETLSIRGGEEKFIGSVVSGANLNLLVPE